MLRTLLTGLVVVASSAALAAPADDYVNFKTALAINDACGGLKYLEHTRTRGAAIAALNATSEAAHLQDGRLTEDEYANFVAGLDARAEAQAETLGCGQAAVPYIMAGKARAAEQIHRALILAFSFDASPDVMQHVELGADRKLAAQRYAGYLQQIYGANFEAFAARQRELAIAELPMVNPFETAFGSTFLSPEDSDKIMNAQSMAAYALDEVFFEVSAETAGYIVRPRPLAEQWIIPELRRADAPTVEGMPVVVLPHYDLVEFTAGDQALRDRLYSLMTLTPERRLRVMFFGDTAQLLTDPTVRLYVRTEELPAGANSYDYFDQAAFREATIAFEGVPVEQPCLGAPCFDFPPEATDAFARFENMDAELFVSHLPDAEPIAEDVSYKPGQVSSFYIFKLLAEQ